ncbi:nyn domain-containing protein [Gigaspora margarita]|uniref:Nyn domain-containing protein n=1 Tax=Gigaspora margarita TaxID=4874 RepID=A0A8H4APR6_GIGMA|nr:nyn domain-containing protein [Gigaspora margarita]
MTEDDFRSMKFAFGPATQFAKLVTDLKKSNTPKSNSGLVFVFVDNSNLFIEGKYTTSSINSTKRTKNGSNLVIVGSRPPPNDSLWDQIRKRGFHAIIYDRIANRDKLELGASIIDVIYFKDPGTILLVAGDDYYSPVLTRALNHNWKVETWFWSSGMSDDLIKRSFVNYLDNFYRHFSYVYGQDPLGRNYTLEITDGEMLAKWNDDEIMECFESLELFGWWFRKEVPTIYFYFDNKQI